MTIASSPTSDNKRRPGLLVAALVLFDVAQTRHPIVSAGRADPPRPEPMSTKVAFVDVRGLRERIAHEFGAPDVDSGR